MAAVTFTTLEVTCDNPNCPGNDLDSTTMEGWLVATPPGPSGEPQQQLVFCSYNCYGTHSSILVAAASGE